MNLMASYSGHITAGDEHVLDSQMCPGVSDYTLSLLNEAIWKGLSNDYHIAYGRQYPYHEELIKAFGKSIEMMIRMRKGHFNTDEKTANSLKPMCDYVDMCHKLAEYAANGNVIYAMLNMTSNILLARPENQMLMKTATCTFDDYVQVVSMMIAIMQSKLVLDNRIL